MKLTELLKKITPLPWHKQKNGMTKHKGDRFRKSTVALTTFALSGGEVAELQDSYVRHAANTLPELVKAAKGALWRMDRFYSEEGQAKELEPTYRELEAALSRAEEINIT